MNLSEIPTLDLITELKSRHELCPVINEMGDPVCMFVSTTESLVNELLRRDGVESSDIECDDGIAKTIVIHRWNK